MSFGLLATGFVPQALSDAKADLEAALRSAFGESIDLSAASPFGQLVGIFAERYADLWDLALAVYDAANPDSAGGSSLDQVAALTGTVREAARSSTVTLTATGDNATSIASGSVAAVAETGTRFATTATGAIATATAWAALTPYAVGARVRNGGTQRIYLCTAAGTSAASGGPTTTGTAIVDASVTWRYLGDGAGFADIPAEAEDTGPKVASAFTLTTISTPVSGWKNATNLLDATLGADLESDASLRARREAEIRAAGNASLGAILATLLEVADVISATVFENETDTTNGDGLPPHSIECLVRGGADQAVVDAIFASKAAGIATYGSSSGSAVDSQGASHAIDFSRPDEIDVYVTVTLTYDAALYPADGDDQVKAAIVAFGDLQATGKDVVAAAQVAQAFRVAGVLDASADIDTAPSPSSSATIPIALRELAVFDTSRVVVSSSAATP